MTAPSVGTWFATLFAAHQVADHHVQRDRDAQLKGRPGRVGQMACLRHVASYTATAVLAVGATAAVTGARPRLGRVLVGLGLSAVSHYVIDRRKPLERFAKAAGHEGFYKLGQSTDSPCLGTGAYVMDQSAHVAFLYAAALIMAGPKGRAS